VRSAASFISNLGLQGRVLESTHLVVHRLTPGGLPGGFMLNTCVPN
jgi:hypothetical protein